MKCETQLEDPSATCAFSRGRVTNVALGLDSRGVTAMRMSVLAVAVAAMCLLLVACDPAKTPTTPKPPVPKTAIPTPIGSMVFKRFPTGERAVEAPKSHLLP